MSVWVSICNGCDTKHTNLSKYHGHRNFNFEMCKSARRLSMTSHLLTVERVRFRFHPVAGHTGPEGE